uniref:guanylate cyclase n=1 Tax=Sinocyclocheilus grahami TaxID=75366 RepID=A0A672M8E7_SINGR
HPEVIFNIQSLKKFINSQFVLKTRREMLPEIHQNQSMLKLRGILSLYVSYLIHVIFMPFCNYLHGCILVSFCVDSKILQELEERGLHLADIAQHNTTRDLILLNQQKLAEIELSNQLERKKEELRILSRNLEIEKQKSEKLLYAMLPTHIANQLKEGKRVEAGEFKVCTTLFSDVVTFTNICAICMLFVYNKFVYNFLNSNYIVSQQVETIADAYMMVGGVPTDTHAERVAISFVCSCILLYLINLDQSLHTCPVLAGVVGETMPHYCLFGDTVNTASRMESHGNPEKCFMVSMMFSTLKIIRIVLEIVQINILE